MSDYLRLPIRFGPYELLRLVGQGATAQVFEARRIGRFGVAPRVALKRLLPQLCLDRHFLSMFIREATVCGRLQHPNILEVQDFSEVRGQYYLVTDFVDGGDLETLIRAATQRQELIPSSVVLEVITQLLKGLSYAHRLSDEHGQRLNLLHRDIKPSNILFSRAGVVKLADFGLAKARSSGYQTMTDQHVKGTLRYMSPEHVRLEEVTQASDIFSAGLVLFEMLTLTPFVPHDARMAEIIRTIAYEPREKLLSALPRMFEPFRLPLSMALQSESISRYGSADEFLDDLHAIMPQLPPGPTLAAWLPTLAGCLDEVRREVDLDNLETVPEAPADPWTQPDEEALLPPARPWIGGIPSGREATISG